MFVHTWHGGVYLGAVPLASLKRLDINDGNFFARVDPDNKLETKGGVEYKDFEGLTVIHRLENHDHGYE